MYMYMHTKKAIIGSIMIEGYSNAFHACGIDIRLEFLIQVLEESSSNHHECLCLCMCVCVCICVETHDLL